LFALYLPRAELTLHAAVYGAERAERQMLVEALDLLVPHDVMLHVQLNASGHELVALFSVAVGPCLWADIGGRRAQH
jgi:hypothetical protein